MNIGISYILMYAKELRRVVNSPDVWPFYRPVAVFISFDRWRRCQGGLSCLFSIISPHGTNGINRDDYPE